MNQDRRIQDCACLIHSTGYDWQYVEHLYRMLKANSEHEIRLHVYTEADRPVPAPMIKHALADWPGIGGHRKSWWYKMQLFDSRHHLGSLLYFDLDVVLARSIDWIWEHDTRYFWTIRDFRYLWRSHWQGMNSSVMFWDTQKWDHVWQEFKAQDLRSVMKKHRGDQDYLNSAIPEDQRCFLDASKIKSWRWQIKDGGMDPNTRIYRRPDAGTVLDPTTAVMVFHGNPKPHEISDSAIEKLWILKNN